MWNSLSCAVQGKGHIKNNIPCQDKIFSLYDKDTYVIALADGSGSARLSHYGAEFITEYICNNLCDKFDKYFSESNGMLVKKNLVNDILIKLQHKADTLNCNINDLASTLLFVAIKKGLYIIGHIGDGVIGYLKKEELKVASEPKNGEFINTTVFTTSINVMDSMKIIKGSINDIEGFVLMSDGSENSLYQKAEKKISNSIKKIMNLLILIPKNELENMLVKTFESIICQATIDDCSIVFLVKDLDLFKGYRNLTESEKCKLLNLNINYDRKFNYIRVRKRLKRFDTILNFMIQEKDLKEISKHIHLKPKYTQKKYIDKLLMLNFIKISNSKYKTLIFLEKE